MRPPPWPTLGSPTTSRMLRSDTGAALRPQDSNLDLTAPKAVVLPLHQGGSPLDRTRSPIQLASWDDGRMPASDEVDRIVDAWARERPDLDVAPLQVLSRVD